MTNDISMTITGTKAKRIAKTAGMLDGPQLSDIVQTDLNTKVLLEYRSPKATKGLAELEITIEGV